MAGAQKGVMSEAVSDKADLILIVDDDPAIRQLVGDFLAQHGFRTVGANSGAEMDRLIAIEPPALIVLDLMLPGEDGLAICRRLAATDISVIMLSALGEEMDRVVGLELGADDYLAKPVSPRELLARVRAVLRRQQSAVDRPGGAICRFAEWSFDLRRRELRSPSGLTVALSSGEFRLLCAFVERPQRVISRDQLLDLVRGDSAEVFDRAIDVQISRLRKKLHARDGTDLIVTVRNEGYMFAVRPVMR